MTPKQPTFTGQWLTPERLGYIRRDDLSTYLVEVWQSPEGKIREWDATKGQPKIFVDAGAGVR